MEKFGVAFDNGKAVRHAFPRPADVKDADWRELKSLGYSGAKARSIKELALAFSERPEEFTRLAKTESSRAAAFLMTMAGIGRWSAEYALLRGLGRLEIFPSGDAGARGAFMRLFYLDHRPDREEINRRTSRLQLYRGMVYFHLLLKGLRDKGIL